MSLLSLARRFFQDSTIVVENLFTRDSRNYDCLNILSHPVQDRKGCCLSSLEIEKIEVIEVDILMRSGKKNRKIGIEIIIVLRV